MRRPDSIIREKRRSEDDFEGGKKVKVREKQRD